MATVSTLSAREAAETLGVTLETLYAYVSRGQIRSEAGEGPSRARRYSAEDIVRLKARKEQRRDPEAAVQGALDWGAPVLESQLSLIENGRLYYRGHDAVDLARSRTFEEVAALLDRRLRRRVSSLPAHRRCHAQRPASHSRPQSRSPPPDGTRAGRRRRPGGVGPPPRADGRGGSAHSSRACHGAAPRLRRSARAGVAARSGLGGLARGRRTAAFDRPDPLRGPRVERLLIHGPLRGFGWITAVCSGSRRPRGAAGAPARRSHRAGGGADA